MMGVRCLACPAARRTHAREVLVRAMVGCSTPYPVCKALARSPPRFRDLGVGPASAASELRAVAAAPGRFGGTFTPLARVKARVKNAGDDI